MRTTLKPAMIAISLLAFVYSGCQKSANKIPAATTTTSAATEAEEQTMAANLAKGLTGSLAGLTGISATGETTAAANGRALDGVTRAAYFCGYSDDYTITSYPSSIVDPYFYNPVTDKLSSVGGLFKYNDLCKDDSLRGYVALDSLHITGTGLDGAFVNYFVQKYRVKAKNAAYTEFTLRGHIISSIDKGSGATINDSYSKTVYEKGDTFAMVGGRAELSGTATFNQTATFVPIGSKTGEAVTSTYYGTYTFTPNFGITVTFLQNGTPQVFYLTY
jgi:hypothetical protein